MRWPHGEVGDPGLTVVACRGCGNQQSKVGNGASSKFGMNYCYPPEYVCPCEGEVLAWFHVPVAYLVVTDD
jgi:hypothetical protein